jgi:hypothetical protein
MDSDFHKAKCSKTFERAMPFSGGRYRQLARTARGPASGSHAYRRLSTARALYQFALGAVTQQIVGAVVCRP